MLILSLMLSICLHGKLSFLLFLGLILKYFWCSILKSKRPETLIIISILGMLFVCLILFVEIEH